ncbi:MAG: hypothetical protein Q8Q32_00785 [bacterium]|nr:hypothetical protein [bacterium]
MANNKGASNAIVVTIIVLVIVVLLGFWFFNQQQTPVVEVGSGEDAQLTEEQIANVIAAVRRHIVLPEDEEPLVATIINVDELIAEQPFYQGASNGDILIIYGSVAKALIYDPRADRLVNVGPVEVQQDASATVPPETTVPAEGSEDIEAEADAEAEAQS